MDILNNPCPWRQETGNILIWPEKLSNLFACMTLPIEDWAHAYYQGILLALGMVWEAKSQKSLKAGLGAIPKCCFKGYFERNLLFLILESQNLRAVATSTIPVAMKNDCNGFKIVWLLNCFHVFTLNWNTSKDKSGINPVILTLLWARVAKGSSWKRSFITVLFWLKLCLSVLLLLTCIKKVKFAVQAASPDCVFLDAQCSF